MSLAVARRPRIPSLSRFGWLMGLYAENHTRLQRLFDVGHLPRGGYVSTIGDGLDLRIEVLEQHAYTSELRMSYGLIDPATGLADPSAPCACTTMRARSKPRIATPGAAGRT